MPFEYNRPPEPKELQTNIEVYDEKNNLVRVITRAKARGRAGEVELPEGNTVMSADIVPVRVTGVEIESTKGDGETVFIWNCKSDSGEIVKEGRYRIDVKQDDGSGNLKSISCTVNITDSRAM